ncbi:hypothetical protein Zmor_016473 [Zophobas morio]|uniref:Uncharacterized protein n=1 Tax=Zophobas morio TaxID=2755281 RepID=A0AA38M0T7_9CUCU|nr:hypothetical protein Zmor_016473 [Zophobas morio]
MLITKGDTLTFKPAENKPDPEPCQPLNEVIKTTTLGQLADNTSSTILNKVKDLNSNVDMSQIEVTGNPSKTGATIAAKDGSTIYSGSVNVTFTISNNPSPDLKDIHGLFTNGASDLNIPEDNTSSEDKAIEYVKGLLKSQYQSMVGTKLSITASKNENEMTVDVMADAPIQDDSVNINLKDHISFTGTIKNRGEVINYKLADIITGGLVIDVPGGKLDMDVILQQINNKLKAGFEGIIDNRLNIEHRGNNDSFYLKVLKSFDFDIKSGTDAGKVAHFDQGDSVQFTFNLEN